MNIIGEFSGRKITTDDVELIKWARETHPSLSRHELAGTVFELISWVNPAGGAKLPQCMAFFAQMEAAGILELPAIRAKRSATKKEKPPVIPSSADFPQEITKIGDIELYLARPGIAMQKWRNYINAFHRLGDKMVFGSCLHYFICSDGCDLGCLQFSAASWALEPRDKWIGWSVEDRKSRLFLVVNNSRFLILPYVHKSRLNMLQMESGITVTTFLSQMSLIFFLSLRTANYKFQQALLVGCLRNYRIIQMLIEGQTLPNSFSCLS